MSTRYVWEKFDVGYKYSLSYMKYSTMAGLSVPFDAATAYVHSDTEPAMDAATGALTFTNATVTTVAEGATTKVALGAYCIVCDINTISRLSGGTVVVPYSSEAMSRFYNFISGAPVVYYSDGTTIIKHSTGSGLVYYKYYTNTTEIKGTTSYGKVASATSSAYPTDGKQ